LSKNALQKKTFNLTTSNEVIILEEKEEEKEIEDGKFMAKHSVIEENISDANLLNSFDEQMH